MNTALKRMEHHLLSDFKTYDPYDLWKSRFGLRLREIYYKNGRISIPLVAPFFLLDFYAPKLIRLFIKPQEYPIVRALGVLSALNYQDITGDSKYLEIAELSAKWLIENRSPGYSGACWGLNMPWMTKTGYSEASTPFITHTPYCVEALLRFADVAHDNRARDTALSSVEFIDRDLETLLSRPEQMALSYGPGPESRIVINANAYAMMMYAMLAARLPREERALRKKAGLICNFVTDHQNRDGSWYYYADNKTGNFIDCFHSCMVLKNLIKYGELTETDVSGPVTKGVHYIVERMMDPRVFLSRRFSVSANPSITKFDLYDQAELLYVLCLVKRLDLAEKVHDAIMSHFYIPSKGSFGYQIDLFGRLNTMTYLRWAVMPAIHALTEYHKALRCKGETSR